MVPCIPFILCTVKSSLINSVSTSSILLIVPELFVRAIIVGNSSVCSKRFRCQEYYSHSVGQNVAANHALLRIEDQSSMHDLIERVVSLIQYLIAH